MLRKDAFAEKWAARRSRSSSHTTIGPGQIHADQEIRMNLSQKTDLLLPAEHTAGFSRMEEWLS